MRRSCERPDKESVSRSRGRQLMTRVTGCGGGISLKNPQKHPVKERGERGLLQTARVPAPPPESCAEVLAPKPCKCGRICEWGDACRH